MTRKDIPMAEEQGKAFKEGKAAGLQWARELIEEGRTHCVLNNKEQCAQCLAKLMAELNADAESLK